MHRVGLDSQHERTRRITVEQPNLDLVLTAQPGSMHPMDAVQDANGEAIDQDRWEHIADASQDADVFEIVAGTP
jgi:hypothetical protein